jgi:hypothetical protein
MTISGIHDFKKRKDAPQEVISGKAYGDSMEPRAIGNLFRAKEIVVGRAISKVLFYEWEYHDGVNATGLTKLNYYKEPTRGGWLGPRMIIGMYGIFMSDNTEQGGKIEFFQDKQVAEAKYQGVAGRLPRAA